MTDTDAIRAYVGRDKTTVAAGPAIAAANILHLCDDVDRTRAERDALAAALEDIAGMRLVATEMDGTELWVADAECADMHGICHQRYPDRPHDWCQTCVAEIAWSAWKLGVMGL